MLSQVPSYRLECNYDNRVLDLLETMEGGVISGTVKPPSKFLLFRIVLIFLVRIVSFGSCWKQICLGYTRDGCTAGGAWGTQNPIFSVGNVLKFPSRSSSQKGNISFSLICTIKIKNQLSTNLQQINKIITIPLKSQSVLFSKNKYLFLQQNQY